MMAVIARLHQELYFFLTELIYLPDIPLEALKHCQDQLFFVLSVLSPPSPRHSHDKYHTALQPNNNSHKNFQNIYFEEK